MSSPGSRSQTETADALALSERFAHLTDAQHMLSIIEGELQDRTNSTLEVRGGKVKTVRSRSVARDGRLHVVYHLDLLIDGRREKLTCLGVSPVPPDFPWPVLRDASEAITAVPTAMGFTDLIAHVPGLDLALLLFPLDPGLPSLAELTGPNGCEALEPYLPQRDGATSSALADLEILQYKPFARAVLRLTTDHVGADPSTASQSSIYAKLFADDRGAAVHSAMRRLFDVTGNRGALRIPEPLGYDADRRMLVMTHVPGAPDLTSWVDCVEDGTPLPPGTGIDRLMAGMQAAAEALLELQAASTHVPRTRTFRTELSAVESDHHHLLSSQVASAPVDPEVGRLLQRLEALAPADEPLRPAHGSFRHKQTVGGDQDLYVIDWDGLCLAPVGLDTATFICRLRKEPLHSGLSAAPEMTDLADGFRDFVLDRQPLLTDRGLALWEALILTQQAMRLLRKGESKATRQSGRYTRAAHDALGRAAA